MQFKSLLHTYLTWAKRFHLPACGDVVFFPIFHGLRSVCGNMSAIMYSGLFQKVSLLSEDRQWQRLVAIEEKNVSMSSSHSGTVVCILTALRLAALQITNASPYPISTVGEKHFGGFLLFDSRILFLCLTLSTALYNLPQPFSAYWWQDVSRHAFINHTNFKQWLVKSGIDCDSMSEGVHQ